MHKPNNFPLLDPQSRFQVSRQFLFSIVFHSMSESAATAWSSYGVSPCALRGMSGFLLALKVDVQLKWRWVYQYYIRWLYLRTYHRGCNKIAYQY